MSSACEASAGVPACVYGVANVPACQPSCRQAIEARPCAPPLGGNKLTVLPQKTLLSHPHQERAPPAFYGMFPVAQDGADVFSV